MLLFSSIVIALLLVGLILKLAPGNKRKRVIAEICLMIGSAVTYPIFLLLFGEWKAIEGVASLIVFHFILLLGGVTTLIVGLFTKTGDEITKRDA